MIRHLVKNIKKTFIDFSKMKRVSCYLTNIQIRDGSVLQLRPSQPSQYLCADSLDEWALNISTETMTIKERLSFTLCSDVKLSSLIKDEETGGFYNLGQEILTDKLIGLTVRQFLTNNIINLDKTVEFRGFVLADLEF
jgi:hypothetical protein